MFPSGSEGMSKSHLVKAMNNVISKNNFKDPEPLKIIVKTQKKQVFFYLDPLENQKIILMEPPLILCFKLNLKQS